MFELSILDAKANTPVNLVPFFNVSLRLCRSLMSGVTNELKSLFLKSKKVWVIYFKKGHNFAVGKTLV